MSEDVTALYRGPLQDFIARRTALARTARPRDPAEAARIAKLRKPSVTAWAIDQLAGAHPELVADVLAAGADARDAQRSAADAAVGGDDLREATARVRRAVDAATSAVARSHPMTEEAERRIRTTLQAAATGSTADRTALWRGTLDRDLEPAPFAPSTDPQADPPDLTAAIGALRRVPGGGRRDTRRATPPSGPAGAVAERAAGRRAAALRDAAARAGAIAAAKREHADRLAEAARIAEEEAVAAEREAERTRAAAAAPDDGQTES